MSLTMCRYFDILSTYEHGCQLGCPTINGGRALGRGTAPAARTEYPWRRSQRPQRLSYSSPPPHASFNCLNLKGVIAIKLVAAPRYHMSLGPLAGRRDEGSSGLSAHHRAAEPA